MVLFEYDISLRGVYMNQPLYQTIFNDLQTAILTGELPVDSQLPTEKELSRTYKVSRITSKRALTELEQLGLIYRVRGKGSFVKSASPNRFLLLLQKHDGFCFFFHMSLICLLVILARD